jgi:hypothetical protein
MGTHGRSGIERWLLGSVAQKVLRGAGVRGDRPLPARRPRSWASCAAVDLAGVPGLKYALHLGRTTGRPVNVSPSSRSWRYGAAALMASSLGGMREQLGACPSPLRAGSGGVREGSVRRLVWGASLIVVGRQAAGARRCSGPTPSVSCAARSARC